MIYKAPTSIKNQGAWDMEQLNNLDMAGKKPNILSFQYLVHVP